MKQNILKSLFISIILLVGVSNAWGGYNVHWKGNVFFRVPDEWNISTYDEIQISVTRTTQVSGTAKHIEYLGEMTRVGDTRLYYIWVDNNHSTWNQTEYVLFTANTNLWSSNNITISANSQYTTPINYDFTNSEYPYLYNPTSEGNGAAVTGSYSDNGNTYEDRRKNLLQKKQTINLYTNETASNTGGSVKISGMYITGNTTTGTSDVTSSGNDVSYDNLIGATVKLTATPTSGYEFDGWYTAASGGTAISTSTTYNYTCKGEQTLYARFKGKQYTVTLNSQSATTAGTTSVSATYGLAMPSATMPQKTGYTFGGYYTATNGGGTQYYNADGSSARNWDKTVATTLYAKWTANKYTVKFHSNGGTGSMSDQSFTYNEAAKALTANAFSRTGYTFAGWNTKQDGSGTKYEDKALVQNLTATNNATVTLYAQWSINSYNITYTPPTNGTYTIQVGSNAAVSANTTANYNETITLVNTPNTGYEFSQWTITPSVSITNNKTFHMPASAITISATFTPITYTITYEQNGGSGATNTTYTIESAEITLPTNMTKTGYTFAGWYDNSTFSGSPVTTIAAGSTGDKTFYAKWTANTYSVAFNANGGTGTMSNLNFTYGTAQNLSANTFTRNGYTFAGWNTKADGTGTSYTDKQRVSNLTSTDGATVTLYAKWTAIKYNITYENLGGATHTNPDKYTIEDAITFFEPSARNGYTFAGWTPASIAKGSMGDKTITAQWTEKPANTIYIRTNEMWKSNGAKLAVYAWGDEDNTWIDVEYDDCTGDILMADIPAKYTGIKIARLNPNPTSDDTRHNNGYNFDNAWNQTSDLNIPTDNNNLYDLTYIYLKPNSNWTTADARFAAYFYKSSSGGDTWKDMTDADGDGYYSCKKPDGYDWVIFCRMNPEARENNWNNRWNQSANQGIPENNLFTVNDGQWGGKGEDNNKDGATGHWDNNHWDNSQWTTYTAPTYTVTINPCQNGTIQVLYAGGTYTSSTENVTIPNVPIHSQLTITFTPAEGYELTTPLVTYADVVAEDIYSICGSAVISAEFVQHGSTKVIYLRPNDEWLKDDAIFIAHAWNSSSNDQHDYLMTTKDTDYTGAYSCTIDKKFTHVVFARINPEYKTNQELSAAWMWNKTIDLQITDDVLNEHGYRFAIGDKVGGTGENKDYYNGAWEQNTPIWGITSDFNNWHAEDAVFMGYPGKINILLSAANHEFKLYNFSHNDYYGNTGTYTRSHNGQWWTMDLHNDEGNNCTVVADIDNEPYLFQLQFTTQLGTYKKQISITYPDFTGGAYRLAYKDMTPNSFHPAHYIKYNASEELHLDTISFFIHHDKEPEIWLQQCTDGIYTQNPTWETIAIYPATSSFPTSDNPGNAMLPGKRNSDATLHIGNGCGITESGVYNFILQQTNNPGHNAVLNATDTHPYKGDYYIRTDSAEGGWTNYQEASNLMTYSSYADHNEPFSYYFCKWIHSDTKTANKGNVTYTVANDYSRCISDTLVGDSIIGVEDGFLPDSANVRFTWDHETNALARAYIRGSGHSSDRFLVLTGKDENLKDANGNDIPAGTGKLSGILANEKLLTDMGNWIYQVDVKANKETAIKLTAKYNDKTQYFKGSANEFDNLLESTDNNYYKIRIIYDFKTNQLITAWLPDNSNVTEDKELGIDMMIIRTNHEQATQINFTSNKSLFKVGIGYAVMTFTEGHVTGSGTVHDRSLYWVSFPFDVWLRDVTGFGEYGQHWIMEYYDGESRAQNGLWADSDTYWKYITNPNYKLEAGKGYVLCLNLGKMATAFTYTNEVSLYFPSASPLQTITSEVTAAEVPAHTCTIERDNRNIYDSNWNLIGVPGFKDITDVITGGSAHEDATPDVSEECINFYYKYVAATNKYTATANPQTNTFQIMHSYMVQYAGEILWSTKTFSNPPSPVAARRTGEMPSEHTLRLELAQGEDKADQTIIKLQEQDATADFDMNIDMAKIKNSGANIYTLTENTAIMVAGNALPMEKVNIPIGIEVTESGTYTLRMPDGTDGISVTLLDNLTGIHTDMLLGEYTVTLDAGSHLNRFYIAVDPDRTATSVENIGNEAKGDKAKGVEKYLIDGHLYIRTTNGIIDAQGRKL